MSTYGWNRLGYSEWNAKQRERLADYEKIEQENLEWKENESENNAQSTVCRFVSMVTRQRAYELKREKEGENKGQVKFS